MSSHSVQFWDELFSQPDAADFCGRIRPDLASALQAAADFFGPMHGKTLIDLGCGDGASSLFFASRGASVISLDQSLVAVQRLQNFCATNNITSVHAFAADAFALADYGPADFVFGSMILHHVEPFPDFVPVLKRALQPHGRAFFFENNSASPLLTWCRTHLVGKFWIPKYGDGDEFPLTVGEVRKLGQSFDLQQVFPELALFSLIPPYLLRRHFSKQFEYLDRIAFRIRTLRKYSYRQYLFLENRVAGSSAKIPVPAELRELQPQLQKSRSAAK